MSKGSDRKSSRPSGRGKSRAKRAISRVSAAPPPAPNLAWAKWIDALGSNEPADFDSAKQVEERLRSATEAAEHARLMREAASAAAEDGPPRAEKTRPARKVAMPKRHAPEIDPRDLPLAASAAARPAILVIGTPARAEAGDPPPANVPPASMPPAVVLPAITPVAPPLLSPVSPSPPLATPLRDEPLPDRYHDDRITLIARDPYWLYTYWELTAANWARARALLGEAATQLTLRLHDYPPAGGGGSMDIEVNAEARSWYVHGGRPGHAFEIEIGLRAADGRFVPLARSRRVSTPLDRMSEVRDEQWLSPPAESERMYELSGGLATLGSASGELPELLTRRLAERMGSGAVSSFSRPPSARPQGFWFELRAELIVYGATAPDATVTCQGRPVPLRPDGAFTLRFALPDGSQEIACQAIARDHLDSITITPSVVKTTTRTERRRRSEGE